MKKIITGFMLLTGLSLNAQTLGNPNFENWTPAAGYYLDSLPVNWWGYTCNTIHPTTDSYQGAYASRIQGWLSCGIAPGIMVNGLAPADYGDVIQSGTPFNTKPASISGFYKYVDVQPGDSAEVTVILKRWNGALMKRDTVGYGVRPLAANAVYTAYTVNITNLMPGVSPDSIIIMFNSSKHYLFDPTTMALPSLYIDRIVMPETTNGTGDLANRGFKSMIFPNPLSDEATLTIEGGINGYCNPAVHVYDLGGKEVFVETMNGNSVKIRRNDLAKGTYVYRIFDNEAAPLATGKFIVH